MALAAGAVGTLTPMSTVTAASTPYFTEVNNAIPNQYANYLEMVTSVFVHTVPLDVNHDGLEDLVLHYWANASGSNPPSNVPCTNKLVILVQQQNHTFVDQTAASLASPANLGACSAERRVVDLNGDGWNDIVYATSQEDGRNQGIWSLMYAPITALVSRPDGKYQIETFGTPAWYHMVGIGYDAQGKVFVGSGSYSNVSEVHQRAANGTWNKLTGYPALSANAFSLFNATSPTGPSDFLIGNAAYPESYSVGGAWRDAGNVWHNVPNLEVLPIIGTATLISWDGNPTPVQVARLDDLDVTAGTFLDSCQFHWSPGSAPITVLKLSVKAISGGYTGPDQVFDLSSLLEETRLLGFQLENGVLKRVPLGLVHEQRQLGARFFDCVDLNGDGYEDIAVYPYSKHGYPLVYLNNQHESLVYAGEEAYPAQPENWFAGTSLMQDFDHDGDPDLLTFPGAGISYTSGESELKWHFYLGTSPLKPEDRIHADGFE